MLYSAQNHDMVITITMPMKVTTKRPSASTSGTPTCTVGDLPAGWTADVMNVAGELFLLHGYGGVSLAAVMAQTGGSFRDLYQEFGSKEGLFLRAMHHLCVQIVSPWRSLETQSLPIEEALVLFGKALLSTLLSPRLLALHRLILSEATRLPKLAQVWYEAGPYATSEALGELLVARSGVRKVKAYRSSCRGRLSHRCDGERPSASQACRSSSIGERGRRSYPGMRASFLERHLESNGSP